MLISGIQNEQEHIFSRISAAKLNFATWFEEAWEGVGKGARKEAWKGVEKRGYTLSNTLFKLPF